MANRGSRRIPLKGGLEYDVHTSWRKVVSMHRSDVKAGKRSYNRRFRRQERRSLHQHAILGG